MSILSFDSGKDKIGSVFSVDTATIIVKVSGLEILKRMQVNHLIAVKSSKAGQHLIGIISKITRKVTEEETIDEAMSPMVYLLTENTIKVNLIGTLMDKHGSKENVFKRTLDTVPEIDADCFPLNGENLTQFMKSISAIDSYNVPLSLGKYSIDENAEAFLDGDKFFQRHAVIVGSTGSGKSWCVAKLIEQIAKLPMANCILFDIHGEYAGEDFQADGIQHLRIANPSDLGKPGSLDSNVIMLPYWLLTYEEMLAMLLDRSDSNAPNQAMLFSRTVFAEKEKYVNDNSHENLEGHITIDSPVPYKLDEVINHLNQLDNQREPGATAGKDRAGAFNGKLTRFIQRLDSKRQDKRLGFMFQLSAEEMVLDWLNKFCCRLMNGSKVNDKNAGIKIIDFSEVPSDILPLVIGLVGRLIFSVQQWSETGNRHPIALLCDEAHLYIPERLNQDSASELGLKNFERIAKEGRKYGVSLVVISQRPSEVNRTVLSQCNNFISLRLSNAEDQGVIKKLRPDNLAGLTDVLPVLDIGEALIVGDASLLPTRVIISEPSLKPQSATIRFWNEWSKDDVEQNIESAVLGLRKQSRTSLS